MRNSDDIIGRHCCVFAIVVTYFPEVSRLGSLLESLVPQVQRLVIVDNTPTENIDNVHVAEGVLARFPSVMYLPLGDNLGIAAAQNAGIRIALESQCEYILLSDQDSIPSANMVDELVATARDLREIGTAVGCVCPTYFDETTRQSFSFQTHPQGRVFYTALSAEQALPWVEIVTAISSGSLIPVSTIAQVGGMREDFFIDQVDSEWCHRARALGFSNFGTARATLRHRLGDQSFRVWRFGWCNDNRYSETRLYYRFRNFVAMIRMAHVPWRWSARASLYWLATLYGHALFGDHRIANICAIARGLRDGMRGRSGKI